MLVLTRKVGEQICVPELEIVVTVLEIRGPKVRLGIAAPEKIAVVRKELRDDSPQHGAHPDGSKPRVMRSSKGVDSC